MGKTFSESWHRVQGLRAQLRPQVRVRRQYFRGERWYLLHDPYNNQFFRVRPAAYAFVLRLGPKATVGEAWETVLQERPEDAPGQQDVVELLSQLYQSNLLVADVPADTAALFQRYQKRVQREVQAKVLGAMFARFPLFDPDDFLERMKPISDRVFSVWGLVVWLGVLVFGFSSLAGAANELVAQSRRVLDPGNLPWLLLVTAAMKALHEFGHMALCKKYGGTVRRAGILLMIFTPMPFADTTSAWGFRERGQRLLVGFGGMIVEVFIAAVAAVFWAYSGPGLVRDLAFNAMVVGSVSTLLFNLNPLLRFDGYFILSDLTGIANLYQRSLQFLRYLCERYLFGLRREVSPANDRAEAWVFVFYGIGGAVYRFFLFASILLFVWDRFLLLGVLMGAVCLVAWVVVPLGKLGKYLSSSPKLHLKRTRALGVVLGSVLALIIVARWLPLPQSARAAGVLQAERVTALSGGTEGRVEALLAEPGTWVESGQALLRLEDPTLAFSRRELDAQLSEGRSRSRQALAENRGSLPVLQGYLEALQERDADLREREAALTVVAPHAGWWVAPELENSLGSWMPRGSSLGQILDTQHYEFWVKVPVERMAQLGLASDRKVALRLDGQPWTRMGLTESRFVAAAPVKREGADQRRGGEVEIPYFIFRARVEENEDAILRHGLAGQVRFALPSESLWSKGRRMWGEFFEKRGSAG